MLSPHDMPDASNTTGAEQAGSTATSALGRGDVLPRHPEAIVTPNKVLLDLREGLRSPYRPGQKMSRPEFADAVNRALYRLYPRRALSALYVDARWVGKLERGETRWPSEERRAALRYVFGVATDIELDLFSPRRTESAQSDHGATVRVGADDWEATLEDFRAEWRLLVDNDKLFGPGYALVGVTRQLDLLDTHLGQSPKTFHRELNRLAALYSESAAWLSQSLDDDAAAERWARHSLTLASRTDDKVMTAWARYRSSQHWLSRRVPGRAAEHANIAARHEFNLPAPMRAAIRVQQAHALAAGGAVDEALTLIDEAHRWAADRHHGPPDGDHGSYCTSGYIEVYRGACLRLARRPTEAIAVLEAAVPAIPRLHRQDYASALLTKAAAHHDADEPEAAATTAHSALPIARRAGARRLLQGLNDLGASLEPHRNLAEVSAYLEDLAGTA
ncbi:hypothetical protein ACIA5C_47005 [Actinoplanes sp. NPDC051343]|uniref:hypothetical protein n=1 Tax=Actinoplanes sp. NPDC051343 TaxID=3363906 RepID=UPI003799019C